MKHALMLVVLLSVVSPNVQAEDELHPAAKEVIRKTITEHGKWGVVQPNAKSKKAQVWVWVTEAPVKLFDFDLELPPRQCPPDVDRDELKWDEHKDMFPDLKEKPEGKNLWVYSFEQEHVTSVTQGGDVKVVQTHVHAQACIYDMTTGKIVSRSSRKFYRLAAYKKGSQKEGKPEC